VILFLLACAHRPTEAQLSAPPSLPPPQSKVFSRVAATPTDPAVARLVPTTRWDAALAGAAGGLGLEASLGIVSFQPWEIREAAWRAGYPIPVRQARSWSTPVGGEPPAELLEWLATVDEHTEIGLVRARSPEGDAWVALAATPRVSLPPVPREARVGAEVRFPPIPGATVVWSDPVGGLAEASLAADKVIGLHTPGCWLFDVRDAEGVAARFPVWVGMAAPDLRLYALPELPGDPAVRAEVLLAEVRALGSRPAWTRDATLDLLAARRLNEPDAPLGPALAKLGYDAEHAGSFSCEAPTLEACLDQILWRPEGRRVVLAAHPLSGLAVDTAGGTVRIAGLVAPE
jgi:hypothetical protein